MILVKPSAEILAINTSPLQLIERAGRTCYKSEDRITDDSAAVFCKGLITRHHEAVIEHSMMTIRFVCDRGVSHELVRHRLTSPSQESTRYCDYNKGQVTFVIPPWVNILEGRGTDHMSCAWKRAMEDAETHYKYMRACGWKPEQARSVLPNSLKTEIAITTNFREWRHIFNLRAVGTTGRPHPQMVELMSPLLAEVKRQIPVIFDDIVEKDDLGGAK